MTNKPRRALLVIDVQKDYFSDLQGSLPLEYPPTVETLANIGRVMDAARSHHIPIIVVQHLAPSTSPVMALNSIGAELHPEVANRHYDHCITKEQPDAFCGTDLARWLKEQAIDTVTVVGYMTHNCDLSTIISGMHMGWSMEFLSDCASSLPYANQAGRATAEEMHRIVCVVLQARFAAVLTAVQWVAGLESGEVPERSNILSSFQQAIAH